MTNRENVSASQAAAWLRSNCRPGAKLTIDSRRIEPGDVFVALPGAKFDGMSFADVAVANGARAILTTPRGESLVPMSVPVFEVEGLAGKLGQIAADFYDNPSSHMMGVAVTGTNGKTSVSHWICRLLSRMHHPCAAIGTLGCFYMSKKMECGGLTTPDAATMQEVLAGLYDQGAQAFAVEASSIGLDRGRLDGCRFHTAVFTNLTRDHLDYHGSMQAYADAKEKLFDWKFLRCAVINLDDPVGIRFAEKAKSNGVRVIGYTLDEKVECEGVEIMRARNIETHGTRVSFDSDWAGRTRHVDSSVVGRFNISNLLATAATAVGMNIPADAVFERISELTAPAGRLEIAVAEENCPLCVVDYAHTPDAMQKALETLREVADARGGALWCVFGAGGDRDSGKRPQMGAVAVACADRVVLTDDNPRSEDPQEIICQIAAGFGEGKAELVEHDRQKAVTAAVCAADARDVVLIAGKGHEDYQIVNGVKSHFSDVEAARTAANERSARGV